MAVVDSDIIIYGSAVMPLDDITTQIGGAIDLAKRVVFTDIDPAGSVEALSDGTDTRTLTLEYFRSNGSFASESKALTSGTPITFTDTDIGAIIRATLSAPDAARTVTVREPAADDLIIFAPNETEVRRPFYRAEANPSGGATKTYYEKVFIKNTSGADDLTSSDVILQADPTAVISFALETTLDGITDNGVGNNRQVAPVGFIFDTTTKAVANSGTLSFGTAQGVWLKLTLLAGIAPADTTFTMRLQGVTV